MIKNGDWIIEIPRYDTKSGTVIDDGIFTEDAYRTRVTNTTREEYEAYCRLLAKNGYSLYANHRIRESRYATYTGERAMVHVYFASERSETRILYAPMEKFVAYPLAPVSDETDVATPSVTIVPNDGAGFIYTMSDGSYVVIDGSWGYRTEGFYRFLRENNKRADGKILIRAWIITHFHEDHYGNFESFAEKYANAVTLEYLVLQLDRPEKPLQPKDFARINGAAEYFEKGQGTVRLIPQVGQVMYFGEARFEFLHTQERLYPDCRMTDGNDYSLAAMVTFAGKRLLMLGDGFPNFTRLVDYDTYLKCDYVQSPHHGYGGTRTSFYDMVDAEVVFVNATAEELAGYLANSDKGNYGAIQYAIGEKKLKYYVTSGDFQTISFG